MVRLKKRRVKILFEAIELYLRPSKEEMAKDAKVIEVAV